MVVFGAAMASAFATPQVFANHHSGNGLPSWYINPRSPHITRAQALALTAPITGNASSTAPSAGAPDPASTTAYLANLRSQYNANPQAFAALAPKYAVLFNDQAQIAAGNTSAITGLVPTTPLWNYLRFRRSLDPARFDFHHPRIGPLLDLDQQIRNQIDKPPLPQIIVPPPPNPPPSGGNGGGSTPPNPPPTPPLPPAVPEPASVVLFLTGLAGLSWYLVSQERQRGNVVLVHEARGHEVAEAGSFAEAFGNPRVKAEPSPA